MLGAHSPADMLYSRFIDWTVKHVVGKHFVQKNFGDTHIQLFWGRGGSDVDVWQPRCEYLNSYYNKSRDLIRLVGFGLVTPCGRVLNRPAAPPPSGGRGAARRA